MNYKSNVFTFLFLCASFLMFNMWQYESTMQSKQRVEYAKSTSDVQENTDIDFLAQSQKSFTTVQICTDVLDLRINTLGGDIYQANLLKYGQNGERSKAFKILNSDEQFSYVAQSEIVNIQYDTPSSIKRSNYSTQKENFRLQEYSDFLHVPFFSRKNSNDTFHIKSFVLKRGKYEVDINYFIENDCLLSQEIILLGQIKQSQDFPKSGNYNNISDQNFRGVAYSTDSKKYGKYKFNNISNNNNLNVSTKSGWLGMLQQYFTVAWIPKTLGTHKIYTSLVDNKQVSFV